MSEVRNLSLGKARNGFITIVDKDDSHIAYFCFNIRTGKYRMFLNSSWSPIRYWALNHENETLIYNTTGHNYGMRTFFNDMDTRDDPNEYDLIDDRRLYGLIANAIMDMEIYKELATENMYG